MNLKHVLQKFIRNISIIKNSANSLKSRYDAIVIGAGHNGLIAAAYLQASGIKVCVLERREIVGGAAVTEELYPGFHFSRASYLLSLLRPIIIKELDLEKHGLKYYFRDPSSYTPIRETLQKDGRPKSLSLSHNLQYNQQQIARFSTKDAQSYEDYSKFLEAIVKAIDPLLDHPPISFSRSSSNFVTNIQHRYSQLKTIIKTGSGLMSNMAALQEILTAPASKILNRRFETDVLKATLATDAIIGAMLSPDDAESGYVLLHHIMGSLGNKSGAWAYVRGGMGAVSRAIASAAEQRGVSIFTDAAVDKVLIRNNAAEGVLLEDGREIKSKIVLSNATANISFLKLVDKNILAEDFLDEIRQIDYTSPVTKINIAVDKIPNFSSDANVDGKRMDHHGASIHLNCENIETINEAYTAAKNGKWAKRPVIEMSIPSSVDDSLAPKDCHVVQLFTQYTPYFLEGNRPWTQQDRQNYFDDVIESIEEYTPGFRKSILFHEILTPTDIERIFSLTGGNIFHGSMSLSQLYWLRPSARYHNYATPVLNYYLCGSGTHPGGGVMGSSGRLSALQVLKDHKK